MASSIIIGIVWCALWLWFMTWLISNERFTVWSWRFMDRIQSVIDSVGRK